MCKLLLVVAALMSLSVYGSEVIHLKMNSGGVELIPLDDVVDRIAVGDPNIIDARVTSSDEIIIIGMKHGYSELVLWNELGERASYSIQVRDYKEQDLGRDDIEEKLVEMLEMEVHVAEVKSRLLRNSGISSNNILNGPEAGVFDGSPFINFNTSLRTSLQLMQERGEGAILANPVLRVESGETAEFLVGGEVPLPQPSIQGTGRVDFRSYGLILRIAPVLMPNGSIRTTIFSELSNLDGAVNVQGIPGLLTRQTSSTVAAKPGETLILSGFTSKQRFHSESAPKTTNLSEEQTELVVFITPDVLASKVKRETIKKQYRNMLWQSLKEAGCTGLLEATHGVL